MIRSAAIFLAITGIGALWANDSTGRPFAAGRAMPFHPGVGVARPLAFAPRPAFHARSNGHLHGRLRHRGGFGAGLWPWYDGSYPSESYTTPYAEPPNLSYDGAPPIYPEPPQPPAAPPPVQVLNIIPYRPGCDTRVERLPWKEGTEKTIRIVRC